MYLKRLELKGFKSFPDKIKFKFEKGVTAIVGPNGSGKSNISDAIRWVLGEQSAKSLRGSKMEDIIFAGTQNRKALGFAEVSLVLNNENQELPVEYSEVVITRRVYRSGESNYLINNTNCRLKDVQELFMDTGIGREGYSIIGQGKIDEILSARSEERRYLFEEAAGIVKFRKRREETLLKLERERENLTRLNDIISEIEAQLEPLEKQSIKAKEFLVLRDELKLLRINIFLIDALKTESEIKEFEVLIKNIIEEFETENFNKEKIIQNIIELKDELKKIDTKIKENNSNIIELRSNVEQKNNDVNLINNENSFVKQELKRLQEEKNSFENNTENLNLEKINLERKFLELKKDLEENNNILNIKKIESNNLNQKINTNESNIEKYNTDIIESYRNISEIQSILNRSISLEEIIIERQKELENLKYKKNLEIKEIKTKEENLEFEKEIISKNFNKEKIESKNLQEEIFELEKKLEDKNFELINISKNLNEKSSRYKIIEEFKKDYEGYNSGTKSILKERDFNKNFKGICGAIGELINVSKKFETAIEIALGYQVQNIITETEKDAKIAIDFLKQEKKGRGTFLPLNIIKSRELKNYLEIKNNIGVLGLASDIINYNPKFNNIMKNLLGSTIICDTLENGLILSKKYNNSFKIVTIDGDILNIGGSLTGGYIYKKTTGTFSKTRELNDLEKEVSELKVIYNNCNTKILEISNGLKILKEKININQNILNNNEMKLNSLTQSLNQINEILSENYLKEKEFNIEFEQLTNQLKNIKKDIEENKTKINSLNNNTEKIKNELSEFQSSIVFAKENKENNINQLTDLKILISEITENIKSLNQNISRINNEIKKNLDTIEKYKESFFLNKESLEENNNKIIFLKEEIINLNNSQEINNNLLKKIEEEKINTSLLIDRLEKKEKEQLNLLGKIEKEKIRLELKQEQIIEKRKNLFDSMWEEYNITFQQALKFEKKEENINSLYKKENNIKSKIKNLGNINVGAIEEYKNLKERYDFLTSQIDDIVKSEEKLRELIFELTKLMSKQFKEQFNIISKNFTEVFSKMFEGGKATLKLVDENNILDSGIEIIAQPPGKKLQNMNLLSGGERALTAIALLFAILEMKPSPFCILDEIEAALDEANVDRYANYLKNFEKNTQFIIITHRKGTMDVADSLYGITMEEQGISKLVSVSLESSF